MRRLPRPVPRTVSGRAARSAARRNGGSSMRLLLVSFTALSFACSSEKAPAPAAPAAPAPAPAAEAPAPAKAEVKTAARASINPRLLRRFQPVDGSQKQTVATTQAEVDLGRMLWFDARLSVTRTLSCDSCHTLSNYGVDGRTTSLGHDGKPGRRNAPTVYNASEHFALFWDGRA